MFPFSKSVCGGRRAGCPPLTLDPAGWAVGMAALTAEGCDRVWSRCLPLPQHLGHHFRAIRGMAQSWGGGWVLASPHLTYSCIGVPEWARDWPVALLCSQCLSRLLLQCGSSASRPADGSADEGVLWGADRTNPPVESQVVSVLWHPAPSDVAH